MYVLTSLKEMSFCRLGLAELERSLLAESRTFDLLGLLHIYVVRTGMNNTKLATIPPRSNYIYIAS